MKSSKLMIITVATTGLLLGSISGVMAKDCTNETITGKVVCEVRDADTGALLAGWATEAGT